ncbi:MAG TPA: App1 family protein [Pirellulales bacterium]|nr:App1 family protein [Pirellulales bacterium]
MNGYFTWPRGLAVALLVPMVACAARASDLPRDEEMVFFNTSACLDPQGRNWLLPVHGWVFEPDEQSKVKAATLEGLRRLLDIEPTPDELPVFRARAWPFLVENRSRREFSVRVGNRYFILPKSESNGHIRQTIRLPVAEADTLSLGREPTGRWIQFSLVTAEDDDREFAGWARLIAPRGLSVVSDIDDTIKITEVADHKEVLKNTFLRSFEAVPGMADVYRDWAESGAVFHYVSAGPWQLYAPLTEFQVRSGFPAGSFELQPFRWKDKSAFNLFREPDSLKRPAIDALLAEFPLRRFIMVGDSGQRDPEMYAELYRRHPRQIARIYIRNVTRERRDGPRFLEAFAEVPPEIWRVFERAIEIERDELPKP